jgi:hypothetical protein
MPENPERVRVFSISRLYDARWMEPNPGRDIL